MEDSRPLSIPVILGTSRKGRMSEQAARFVAEQVRAQEGVVTELIDICDVPLPVDDAGEAIKHPGFADKMARADGIVVVTPEYNRGLPGLLKHVLDSCLKEYVHKAVGLVGVSAGPFGGARVIENALPPLRELGLVTIFWDVNVANVAQVFDESGRLLDPAFLRRTDKFLKELIWMSRTLRYGRETYPIEV